MNPLTLTQQWLKSHASSYPHKDRVYTEIDAALTRYPTLGPKSDIYTYDDGRAHVLLCVHGLLPIAYRQVSYNIPIAIWVTREYPRQSPIGYVVPTTDMLVKAGKHIDVSGKCNLEYSQQWERKSEGCNLVGLLEAMQDQFSREPPVYAKPKHAPSPSPASTVLRPQPAQHANTAPIPSSNTTGDRPILPPKPGMSNSANSFIYSPHSPALAARPPPPLPPSDGGVPPRYGSPLVPPTYQHRQIQPHNQQWVQGPQHLSNSPAQSPPPPPPHHPIHSQSTGPGPSNHQQYTQTYQQPAPPPPPPPQVVPTPNLLDEDEPPSSDFTAQSAPGGAAAPPRPMNPELLRLHGQVQAKLHAELSSLAQATATDDERLRAQQNDLLAGEPAIRDEMARLEAVRDVCRTVAGRMRGTVDQAERNMSELRRKGDPEVDELVCSTSIVHNQLINLVAEDNAIEDTIYHLHRALNTGRIDLERFLRSTRVLAEEQFMKRALIEKIHSGTPIGAMAPAAQGWS